MGFGLARGFGLSRGGTAFVERDSGFRGEDFDWASKSIRNALSKFRLKRWRTLNPKTLGRELSELEAAAFAGPHLPGHGHRLLHGLVGSS